MLLSSVISVTLALQTFAFPQNDYFHLFNPQNYLEQLPSLSLPYLSSIPIPSMRFPTIKPTPVAKTKVINVVTKYVSQNPVCLKFSGTKPPCTEEDNKGANSLEYLVTKEYFVRDPLPSYNVSYNNYLKNYNDFDKSEFTTESSTKSKKNKNKKKKTKTKSRKGQKKSHRIILKNAQENNGFISSGVKSVLKAKKKLRKPVKNYPRNFEGSHDFDGLVGEFNQHTIENMGLERSALEPSEVKFTPRSRSARTPKLSASQVQDLLIEDRLDQLEDILPHYTRKRVYQTSTITITKTRNNNMATATLLVKNCVPQGIEMCPTKIRKKKKKVPPGEIIRYTRLPSVIYG